MSTAFHSNQRTRRETSSLTLEDVRMEIRSQLRSVTADQLCSSQEKVCRAGPPGQKGEPGIKGRRGKKGLLVDVEICDSQELVSINKRTLM